MSQQERKQVSRRGRRMIVRVSWPSAVRDSPLPGVARQPHDNSPRHHSGRSHRKSWNDAAEDFADIPGQFRLMSEALSLDYWELREVWALDPRMNKIHTGAWEENRGFGGKCLPKDLLSLIF
ncbi:MAG: hypothetical protein ACRDQ5_26880, partial [Sciscionella sp.]